MWPEGGLGLLRLGGLLFLLLAFLQLGHLLCADRDGLELVLLGLPLRRLLVLLELRDENMNKMVQLLDSIEWKQNTRFSPQVVMT